MADSIRRTIAETLEYYNTHPVDIAKRYEQVDGGLFLGEMPIWVVNRGKILDIGCGSGRDASFLLSEEYDVYGIDGSQEMLDEAVRLHPELKGRLTKRVLPDMLPYDDDSFDAVISIAFMMHLDKKSIAELCKEIRRVLTPYGVFWLSIRLPSNTAEQEPKEQDVFDEWNRFFLQLSADHWRTLIEQFGFHCKKFYMDHDALGRECSWGRFAFVKDNR